MWEREREVRVSQEGPEMGRAGVAHIRVETLMAMAAALATPPPMALFAAFFSTSESSTSFFDAT